MTYHLSFVTKRGSSFGMRVVMYLGGLSFVFEGCSEDICSFLFFLFS